MSWPCRKELNAFSYLDFMKAIMVLGTGRSGTSALAGCLQLLGGFCGNNLRVGNEENAKGYFEDKNITDLNKYLLNKCGIPWYNHTLSIEGIRPLLPTSERIELIKYAIHLAYGTSPIIVIKDPRICVLFFCYQDALVQLGYDISYIRSVREESQKIKSIIFRTDAFSPEQAQSVISKYDEILNRSLLMDNINPLVVNYDSLLFETDKTISEIQEYLPFLDYTESKMPHLKDFLDPSLKHF